MGCDIHLYVERKVDGKWVGVNPPKPPDPIPEGKNRWDYVGSDWSYQEDRELVSWEIGRNYTLFTILSGVRNDSVYNKPIKECPYELPPDVSPEVKAMSEMWDCDGHSHSFYTLRELQEHDWNQPFYEIGVISLDEAIKVKENGGDGSFLTSWCGWSSGQGIEVLPWTTDTHAKQNQFAEYFGRTVTKPKLTAINATPDEMREWSRGIERPLVQMQWTYKQSDSAGWLLETLLPEAAKLGELDDVRFVFWYDN